MTPSVAALRNAVAEGASVRQLRIGRGVQGPANIGAGASVGAGCVLFPGVQIGAGAVLEPGAVAFRDVPAGARVRAPIPLGMQRTPGEPYLIRVEEHPDPRGSLRVVDLAAAAGFVARRTFSITGAPIDAVRAQHAHRSDFQVLQMLVGTMQVILCRPVSAARTAHLTPGLALALPPLTWCAMYGFSVDAAVLVHAKNAFDPDDVMELEDLEGWGAPTPVRGDRPAWTPGPLDRGR